MLKYRALLAVALVFLPACASAPVARTKDDARHNLNAGYALFYGLVDENADVSKILIIKSVRPVTKKLINDIAKACADTRASLQQFAKDDPTLGMNNDNLPAMETATRSAISSATAGDLLTSSGPAFETRLLMTQAESTEYASHLAAELAKADDNAGRRKSLLQWSDDFARLRVRVLALLTIK